MRGGKPRLEIAALGSWRSATLVSEYDPEDDVIRVDERALAYVRQHLGPEHATRFLACAVAHESFHRAYPKASEADARKAGANACGGEVRRYEALLGSAGFRERGG